MHTKTKSLALVLVVLASIVVVPLSFVAPAAAAPPAATASPQQIAESFIYYRAIAECFDSAGSEAIPVSDAGSYNWFSEQRNHIEVAVGYMNGDGGKALCSDTGMISRAMSMWGYSDGLTAWCDLMQQAGPYQEKPGIDQSGVNRDCAKGNGEQLNTENKPEDRGFSFKRTIENKYYGAPGAPQLTKAAEYYVYLQTFNTFCNAKQIAQVSQADPSQLALANSDTGYKIKVVNQDGTVTEWIYQATGDQKKDDYITTYQNDTADGGMFQPKCGELAQWASNAADAYGQWQAQNQTAALPTGNSKTGSTGTGDKTISCGGGDWDWAICPFILLAQEAAIKLDGFITGMLNIDAKLIFDNSQAPGSAYYVAWNTFRVMSTALIIIAGLVMVISQALGFDFLDAYTIRKVLPRLVVAIIGISLSWPLMAFFVNLFNMIGYDLRSLIYAPFSHLGGGINPALGLSSYLALFAGGVVLTGLGLLSLVGTALLAMLVAFFILVIRQIAIIVLVVAAPVAIACYILPNTHKGWKLWYDSFLGVLLMFPIISAFIAAGHVFAAVAFSPSAGGSQFGSNTLAQIVGLVAYFIPYFMLPIAFRLATGLVSTLAGFVNDRSRGGFDRLKKFRQAKSAESLHQMKAGNRFSDRNPLTRSFNRTTAGIGSGTKGHFGLGTRGSEAIDQARRNAAATDIMKSAGWNAIQHDDDALRAATYDSAAKARAAGISERAIAAAQASIGFGRPQAIAAAQQLSTTGTGYKNIEDVAKTIARASGGNASSIASMAGFINSDTKRAGRHDLAPGFSSLNNLARQEAANLKAGPSAPPVTGYGAAAESAWGSASLYGHANDKGANIQNAINHHKTLLTSSDAAQREKAGIFFNELKAMQPNASGDVKDRIQKALDDNRTGIAELYDNTSANYLGDSQKGVADKYTGSKSEQVYDPTITDASGNVVGGYVQRTTQTGQRNENAQERVERLSRTYERPDPNNI